MSLPNGGFDVVCVTPWKSGTRRKNGEKMNILFMIGNGFDLNLGLKTSYYDFYSYYKSKNSESNKVEELKKHISNNFKNWSDLELELGNYTTEIETSKDFIEIFEDIGDNLVDYLKQEENKLDFKDTKINKKKLFDDLIYFEKTLTKVDQKQLETFKSKWATNNTWYVDIMTFNYTKSFEKLVGHYETSLPLEGNKYLRQIHHIHGYIDDRMIMGVNDVSQISNKKFHNDLNITEILVKEDCNSVCGHTVDDQCKNLISSSNLICIFGSSLGDTDKLWWDLISKKLMQKEFKLIIFEFVKMGVLPHREEIRKGQIRREKKENFLNKTTLTEEEKKIARENIFVGVNTNLFKDIYLIK